MIVVKDLNYSALCLISKFWIILLIIYYYSLRNWKSTNISLIAFFFIEVIVAEYSLHHSNFGYTPSSFFFDKFIIWNFCRRYPHFFIFIINKVVVTGLEHMIYVCIFSSFTKLYCLIERIYCRRDMLWWLLIIKPAYILFSIENI